MTPIAPRRRPERLAVLLLAPALLGAAGLAGSLPEGLTGWGEPHLAAVPRTEAEAARIAGVLGDPAGYDAPEPFEDKPGGAATVRVRPGAGAFSLPSGNMDLAREADFRMGNALFTRNWVSAPASTRATDGLGPLFNARACQACHTRDGRGHPPAEGEEALSLFLRVSVPGTGDPHGIPGWTPTDPDPTYGGQIQTFGTPGQPAEARFAVTYSDLVVPLAGGESATLRVPTYEAADLAYGPLAPGAMVSPRVAPQMIGLGLLEAVPEADILARADPDDADGDGISGRPSVVWSDEFGQPMLGRFGHKAGMPTIRSQAAGAFAGDMGLSTGLHPDGFGDCMEAQAACRGAPAGADPDDTEVGEEAMDLVAFYSRNLGVPARRDPDDPEVLHGKALFHEAGCASCHAPKFVTHRLEDRPEQSFQLIWPYTDLLLHDMGEGLADGRPEGVASGTEWRTAPLWGIGLTEQVAGQASFLHDGRARSVLEAILWHGGEAQAARDAVADLSPADRAALVRFVESL